MSGHKPWNSESKYFDSSKNWARNYHWIAINYLALKNENLFPSRRFPSTDVGLVVFELSMPSFSFNKLWKLSSYETLFSRNCIQARAHWPFGHFGRPSEMSEGDQNHQTNEKERISSNSVACQLNATFKLGMWAMAENSYGVNMSERKCKYSNLWP